MSREQRGGAMIRTRAEILADLRSTIIDLEASTDEARAVIAIENVEQIREEVLVLRDNIKALAEQIANDRRAKVSEAYIISEYDAMKHQVGVLENVLKEQGLLKRKG